MRGAAPAAVHPRQAAEAAHPRALDADVEPRADLPPVAVAHRPVARAGPCQTGVGPPRPAAPRSRRPVADFGGELAAHVERRRPVGHEPAHVLRRPQPAGALRRRPERRRHVERQPASRLPRVEPHRAGEAPLVVAGVLVGRQQVQRRVDHQAELRVGVGDPEARLESEPRLGVAAVPADAQLDRRREAPAGEAQRARGLEGRAHAARPRLSSREVPRARRGERVRRRPHQEHVRLDGQRETAERGQGAPRPEGRHRQPVAGPVGAGPFDLRPPHVRFHQVHLAAAVARLPPQRQVVGEVEGGVGVDAGQRAVRAVGSVHAGRRHGALAPAVGDGHAGQQAAELAVGPEDAHAHPPVQRQRAAGGREVPGRHAYPVRPPAAARHEQRAGLVETAHPALAVLDLMLPGADGIELMRTLPALADLPVIFVSAYGRGETVARALEAGAADYIVKPFSPAELVARVGVALNRHGAPAVFVLGDLAIDRATRRVTVAGRPVRLTAIEYKLLYALSLDAGGATTHESLRRRVWGDRGGANPQTVRNAVRKLRRKLGDDAGDPKYILTVRGLGYRMPGPDEP